MMKTKCSVTRQEQIDIALLILPLKEPNIKSQSPLYIANLINEVFELDITEVEVVVNLQATLEEDIEDTELIYKHMGFRTN